MINLLVIFSMELIQATFGLLTFACRKISVIEA